MVDLVKIRRKAKERREREEAAKAADQAAETPPVSADQSVPETTKPPKKSRKKREAARSEDTTPELREKDGESPDHAASDATASTPPAAAEAPVEDVDEEARDRVEEFRRKAGVRREAAVSDDETVETQDDQRVEVLIFEISRERYAVEIEQIREITPVRAFTRVPNADRAILGIISLRGTIVTILDVRSRLGHRDGGPVSDDTRIIVVEQGTDITGFVVDRVYRVLPIDRGTIEANPVVTAGEHSRYIRGVFRYNDRITILLDLERLLEQQAD